MRSTACASACRAPPMYRVAAAYDHHDPLAEYCARGGRRDRTRESSERELPARRVRERKRRGWTRPERSQSSRRRHRLLLTVTNPPQSGGAALVPTLASAPPARRAHLPDVPQRHVGVRQRLPEQAPHVHLLRAGASYGRRECVRGEGRRRPRKMLNASRRGTHLERRACAAVAKARLPQPAARALQHQRLVLATPPRAKGEDLRTRGASLALALLNSRQLVAALAGAPQRAVHQGRSGGGGGGAHPAAPHALALLSRPAPALRALSPGPPR